MTIRLGDFWPDPQQPPLSEEDIEVVRRFQSLYFRRWRQQGAGTLSISWFGHLVVKCPLDLWIYQELLARTRPDVVVETGTWQGGSALYLAAMLDLLGHGRVVTVDVDVKPDRPQHPRLSYLTGSSTDPSIVARVREFVGGDRAMVILDSDHRAGHVYDEIIAYQSLVHVGDYLVVEDTVVNGHPLWEDFGPGPWEAVDRFLSENDEFAVDRGCERFLMTLNPRGFLKRYKPAALDGPTSR